MEITLHIPYDIGDRIWMPDGKGGKQKGRIAGMQLFMVDLDRIPQYEVEKSLNIKCINEQRQPFYFHQDQISHRD